MNNIILSTILILSAILLINLSIYGFKRNKVSGALPFSLVMVAMAFHSIGYAFELLCNNLESMYFCIRFEYIGAAFYPFLFIWFTRTYADEKKFADKWILTFTLIMNLGTLILVNTNNYHYLYYSSMNIDTSLGFNVLDSEKGIWYLVHSCLLFLSICYGVTVFVLSQKNSKGIYRKRVTCMLIGVTIPMFTFIIYILNLLPTNLDYTPFSFLFISLFIVFGLFKFDTFFLIPITTDMVFNAIDEAVIVVDNNGNLINFNSASKTFFSSLSNLKMGEDFSLIKEIKDGSFNCEKLILEFNESIYQFKVIDAENKRGTIYVVTDITESELAKKQLEILATEDSLTGLYNRRCFMKDFRLSKNDGVFAIIDIDNFKLINDTYGHDEGDIVLKKFGEIFKDSFRQQKVCRYGGEEFALYFESLNLEQAYDRIESFRRNFNIKRENINCTFSAGLSIYRKGFMSEAISQADKKLYEAKAEGRNKTKY